MGGDTRGQQLLPGDPEGLLQATRKQLVAKNQGIKDYLALSVTVSHDGSVSVRKLRLDSNSRRVVPEHLDTIEPRYAQSLTPAELLRHWSHELVLDELDDL